MTGAQWTERMVLDRLLRKYGTYNGNGFRYTRGEHVKLTTGHDSRRICDFMALDLRPGYGPDSGPKLHGHEVKVSRADLVRELQDPEKSEAFARYCHYWWLVVPDMSIVEGRLDDLPPHWGIMAFYGKGIRVMKQAEKRDPDPLPRDLFATFTRAVVKTTVRLHRDGGDGAITQILDRMSV